MLTYPVGDFFIRIKNAAKSGKLWVDFEYSKFIESVAKVLKKEGFIDSLEIKDSRIKVSTYPKSHKGSSKNQLVLSEVKLVSRPGLRVYTSCRELLNRKGHEVLIISTPKGVMSAKDAITNKVGGEILAEIW